MSSRRFGSVHGLPIARSLGSTSQGDAAADWGDGAATPSWAAAPVRTTWCRARAFGAVWFLRRQRQRLRRGVEPRYQAIRWRDNAMSFRSLATLPLVLVSLVAACGPSSEIANDEATGHTESALSQQSIAVPSYFTDWTALLQKSPPAKLAIVNNDSGPYNGWYDYSSNISAAQSKGVRVVGYVDTAYMAKLEAGVQRLVLHVLLTSREHGARAFRCMGSFEPWLTRAELLPQQQPRRPNRHVRRLGGHLLERVFEHQSRLGDRGQFRQDLAHRLRHLEYAARAGARCESQPPSGVRVCHRSAVQPESVCEHRRLLGRGSGQRERLASLGDSQLLRPERCDNRVLRSELHPGVSAQTRVHRYRSRSEHGLQGRWDRRQLHDRERQPLQHGNGNQLGTHAARQFESYRCCGRYGGRHRLAHQSLVHRRNGEPQQRHDRVSRRGHRLHGCLRARDYSHLYALSSVMRLPS